MIPRKQLVVFIAVGLIGTPVSARMVTLTPDADTYIEAGTESTYDHGKCTYFDVDTSPWGVSYLRFLDLGIDLTRERVLSATLTLRCSNSSGDGGTIYSVPDHNWSEGDRCGSGGFGLKWGDVDCNRDGKITAADSACSSWAPDFSRPIATLGSVNSGGSYTRDVTAAFTYGPPVILAIVNNSSNGATYRSREYSVVSQRPVVRLELEDLPPVPPNDECADAKVIPSAITAVNFTETLDTRSAGYDDSDPDPSCVSCCPRKVVWYTYTPASDGHIAIKTQGSNYDTGVAVYTGTCNTDEDMTRLHEVACAGDACLGIDDGQPSRLSFAAVAGTTYLIMVWDEVGGGGTLFFQLSQGAFGHICPAS